MQIGICSKKGVETQKNEKTAESLIFKLGGYSPPEQQQQQQKSILAFIFFAKKILFSSQKSLKTFDEVRFVSEYNRFAIVRCFLGLLLFLLLLLLFFAPGEYISCCNS